MKTAKFFAAAAILAAFGAGCAQSAPPVAPPAPAPTPEAVVPTPAPAPEPPKPPELQGEVTLGAIYPLTGDGAPSGLSFQKAMNLAVDEINANGGVGGKKLVIAVGDGKCDGKASSVAAEKLIKDTNVPAIIGGGCPGETLGIAPAANAYKRVIISPAETSSDITAKGGDYVFRFAPSDAVAGKAAALYALKELGAKRAAIVSEKTDDAQAYRDAFFDGFDNNGGGVYIDETYKSGTTDFRAIALKIKNKDVDVVYVAPQSPASGIAIVKALKDQKILVKILTTAVLTGGDVAKNNADVLEGVRSVEPFFDANGAAVQTFAAAYKAKYGEDPAFPLIQANAYSEVYALKDLLAANGADGEKLQTALASLKDWSGGALTGVTLDKNGDIAWKSFSLKQITAGAATQAKTFKIE